MRHSSPLLLVAVLLTGCGEAPVSDDPLDRRLAALQTATAQWAEADDVATAHRAAEVVRNLVVGPAGPSYGDGDGDGTVDGGVDRGLLPGLDGERGLAPDVGACRDSDVLGGSWADPGARWAELRRRIDAWRPDANTFPALPSHPQRVVGWASLTLQSDSLDEAHDYAGHAQLHVDITEQDLDACR